MKNTIERHPALQILVLAIAAVAVLYVGSAFVDILAVVNATDVIRFVEAGRHRP